VLKEIQAYESDGVPLRHLGRHKQKETHSVFVSDASDNVAFVYEAETVRLVEGFGFDQLEISIGSGHRELLLQES
jgi:hypothetical protein